MNKIAQTIAGTIAAALALTACGSSGSKTVPTPSSSATPTLPAWAASYTAAQLGDYNAALTAFNAIERREAPIWANPGHFSSAQAGEIFRGDWSNTTRPLGQFATYRTNGVRVSGLPRVISSRLDAIASNAGGSGLEQITIRQCVDGSQVRATQRGAPVPSTGSKRGLREIEMFKTPGGQFKLFQVGEGSGSC